MARQKRMSKQELRAQDKIEVALQETWKRLSAYKKPLLGALAAFVVVGIAYSLYSWQSSQSAAEEAKALRAALAPLLAPVGEAPDGEVASDLPERERFTDRAAAFTAAEERITAYIQSHGGSSTAAVSLARAAAFLPKGDAAGAVTELQKWVADNAGSPLLTAALLHLAQAQRATGDKAAAQTTYKQLADASEGAGKALALSAVGDLNNPLLADGGGDRAAAKEAYEAALAALGPKPPEDPSDPFSSFFQTYLYADIDNKLATL